MDLYINFFDQQCKILDLFEFVATLQVQVLDQERGEPERRI